MTGTIPSELHQLTSLQEMYLRNNYFTGELLLPCSTNKFGQINELRIESLNISNNRLTQIDLGSKTTVCLKEQLIQTIDIRYDGRRLNCTMSPPN